MEFFDLNEPATAAAYYQESAECYVKTLSAMAFESYQKAIGALVELMDPLMAIHLAFKAGYIYEKEFKDFEKSRIFFDKADDLRRKESFTHTCGVSNESIQEFIHLISLYLHRDPNEIMTMLVYEDRSHLGKSPCINNRYMSEMRPFIENT
ncbi:hypothetical protein RF11_06124 [Thelohanellus kitauei]|uniref:Gamma-soluble NSF attachment protein n=1 Tax=Thelohanellus kitauei TaxID=669202 RepID=A0A0C2J6X2_THEKT|nr:hypothetical protein RF11_06124 [Thelohanellus kitauei]